MHSVMTDNLYISQEHLFLLHRVAVYLLFLPGSKQRYLFTATKKQKDIEKHWATNGSFFRKHATSTKSFSLLVARRRSFAILRTPELTQTTRKQINRRRCRSIPIPSSELPQQTSSTERTKTPVLHEKSVRRAHEGRNSYQAEALESSKASSGNVVCGSRDANSRRQWHNECPVKHDRSLETRCAMPRDRADASREPRKDDHERRVQYRDTAV